MSMTGSRRCCVRPAVRRTVGALVLLVGASVAAAIYFADIAPSRPRRFAAVEPGRVYRGGAPTLDHLAWFKSSLGGNTVISLADDGGRSAAIKDERAAAERLGLRFYRFPMPGDGRGSFDALDAAADQLADRGNGVIFFHCSAGKQRSNAALAAYRMRHCGWTLEQALRELDQYDLDRATEAALCEHLRRYYDARVAATRPRRAAASHPGH